MGASRSSRSSSSPSRLSLVIFVVASLLLVGFVQGKDAVGNNERADLAAAGQDASNANPVTANAAMPTVANDDLPTLSKTANTAIPTYPPPTVPPTQDAPFMNRSTLPDGTVFIAVGAILGAFGAALLVWRGIVGCLLHRSVRRAAAAQHTDKAPVGPFPAPPAPFYKHADQTSSPSLPTHSVASRSARRTSARTPSASASQLNLFFSPTAGGGTTGAAPREPRYMPSGYYATAVSPSPSNGSNYGHGHSISLSNLRPASRTGVGLDGATNPITPPSPDEPPPLGRGGHALPATPQPPRSFSTGSITLQNRPPSGRAPSAFLDHLLDDQMAGWSSPPPADMPGPRGGSWGGRF